jgi:hypothetical protein
VNGWITINENNEIILTSEESFVHCKQYLSHYDKYSVTEEQSKQPKSLNDILKMANHGYVSTTTSNQKLHNSYRNFEEGDIISLGNNNFALPNLLGNGVLDSSKRIMETNLATFTVTDPDGNTYRLRCRAFPVGEKCIGELILKSCDTLTCDKANEQIRKFRTDARPGVFYEVFKTMGEIKVLPKIHFSGYSKALGHGSDKGDNLKAGK